MPATTRHARRWILTILGTLWGGLMIIGGLWMALVRAPAAPGLRSVLLAGGVSFSILGVFVFAAMVADRVFPRADPRVTAGVELALWCAAAATSLMLLLGGSAPAH